MHLKKEMLQMKKICFLGNAFREIMISHINCVFEYSDSFSVLELFKVSGNENQHQKCFISGCEF